MASNTPTTLASRLKEQFADGISQLVPGTIRLGKLKFRKELGKNYNLDLQLSDELGHSVGQGSVTLNGTIAQSSARATVDAYSHILQYQASYDLINRAQGGGKSFASFTDSKFIPATESFQRRQEILYMYGREGLGKVLTNTSGALVISVDTWCPTVWLGLKGATLEAWTSKSAGSQHNGVLTISAVDVSTRTVTVTGTSSAVVADDHLFFTGTHAAGHIGLMSIARNTGTIFGVDAAVNEVWKANSYDVGTSAITLGKILSGAALAANKGCAEKLVCLVPIKAYQGLVADESALRSYGADYNGKAKNGFSSITFLGASGEIEVQPYQFIKEGEMLMYPERWTYIIGSGQMDMEVGQDGKMYFDVATTSDKEMRLFADTQIFCEKPGYVVFGTRSDSLALHS